MNEISASSSSAAEPTLRVESAQVRYGHLVAVSEVSFEVRKGEVVVLLGANGAGKSSLLKAIIGLEPLAEGSASLEGEPLAGLPVHRRAGKGIGYLPEGRGVFPNMTVEENILTGVTKGGARQRALDTAYGIFPVLKDRRKQIAGSMSGGEQQMLSLSRALASDPKLLLLDELSLGLAPKIVSQLFQKVGELRNEGHSILLVEQFAHAALRVADRAGVVVRGEMTRFGPAADLAALSADELARLYFGTAEDESAPAATDQSTPATTEAPET
jgi:branched-chain amino acid transport system ATP-binding protein